MSPLVSSAWLPRALTHAPQWEQYTDPFTAAVLPILGTRLLLNLREAAIDETERDMSVTSGANTELNVMRPTGTVRFSLQNGSRTLRESTA